MSKIYKGRFAPTPSGPAHPGTLLAAIGSFLQARANGGEWHIRIDDIDPPREVAGAADSILHTLENYGLFWDGPVVYQSQRHELYEAALHDLAKNETSYPCACSRREIEAIAIKGPNGAIYPGTCRNGVPAGKQARSVRLRVEDKNISMVDVIQGHYRLNLAQAVGDFIIRRSDGLYAYHLATVVDDAHDGFNEIVRGADLLSITPQQIWLQQQLGYSTPEYAHLPMLIDARARKLSKRFAATAVDKLDRRKLLKIIFKALGLSTSEALLAEPLPMLWQEMVKQWDIRKVPAEALKVDEELYSTPSAN